MNEQSPPSFPVVCLGGSAGSLDPILRVFDRLRPDLGITVVIVNHVRRFKSQLPEILSRHTRMPVHKITEGLALTSGQVYIIPADRDLSLLHGRFHVHPTSKPRGWPDVITLFLNSLVQEWTGVAVGVILSGMDGDGAAALKAFKALGGITIAQTEDSCAEPSMPGSAVDTGFVDLVLTPEGIAEELERIALRFRSQPLTAAHPSFMKLPPVA